MEPDRSGPLIDDLVKGIGGFAAKSVLDLGGGADQYTAAMEQRRARIALLTASRRYCRSARSVTHALGLEAVLHLVIDKLGAEPCTGLPLGDGSDAPHRAASSR